MIVRREGSTNLKEIGYKNRNLPSNHTSEFNDHVILMPSYKSSVT